MLGVRTSTYEFGERKGDVIQPTANSLEPRAVECTLWLVLLNGDGVLPRTIYILSQHFCTKTSQLPNVLSFARLQLIAGVVAVTVE